MHLPHDRDVRRHVLRGEGSLHRLYQSGRAHCRRSTFRGNTGGDVYHQLRTRIFRDQVVVLVLSLGGAVERTQARRPTRTTLLHHYMVH